MFPPKLDAKELETRSVEEEELEKAQEENVDEVAFLINEDIIQCFALFDQNKTGTFPSKYLDKALKCLGILITSVELEDVEQNVAKDGVVTFQEFYNYAFEKMYDADQLEALQLAFSAFDPDDQRVIPSDRLKKWLMTLGNPLTDKEAKELIELGDPANRGFVVYDDLVGVLLAE